MACTPLLIPKFSGMFYIDKKTCVIMVNSKYAAFLESIHQPSKMVGVGCFIDKKSSPYYSSIDIENFPRINLSDPSSLMAIASALTKEWNVILHVDEKELLDKLLFEGFYHRKEYLFGISTGADRSVTIHNFIEELGFDTRENFLSLR